MGVHVAHEGHVDLELEHRKALQPLQRRVAGAEVVDGQAETRLHQPRSRMARLFGLVHQRGFGHFQLDHAGLHPLRAHQVECALRKAFVHHLRCRHVDRHAGHHRRARFLPVANVACGLGQRPVAQLVDQPALFRHRNEFGRADPLPLFVAPARERFHAAQRAGGQVHLGLVVQL